MQHPASVNPITEISFDTVANANEIKAEITKATLEHNPSTPSVKLAQLTIPKMMIKDIG